MSVAKEAKLKEWSCNIFSQTLKTSTNTSSQRPEQQLFSRKRRSEASDSSFNGGVSEALNRSSSRNDRNDRSFDSNFYKKKDQGIFLYESANAKGSLTPSGSDYCSTKKYKEGLSMQNILQPYLALDVIKIDSQGYVPNITNANTTMNKDRSAPRLNQQQQQKQNLNNSFNCQEKYGGSGPQTTKHNKINLNTHLKLEMDSIKEEDNSVFKGLGKNHDKGLKQLNSKNQQQEVMSGSIQNTSICGFQNTSNTNKSFVNQNSSMKQFQPVLRERQNQATTVSHNASVCMVDGSNQVQTTRNSNQNNQFTPYFVSLSISQTHLQQMHVLNQSNSNYNQTTRNTQKKDLSKSMLASSDNKKSQPGEFDQLFKGIGQNHQRDLDKSQNRDQPQSERFQISSAHDWKTEIYKPPCSEVNPKEMQKQQQRSDMDSQGLRSNVDYSEKLSKSFVSQNAGRDASNNKLPTYLETQNEKYKKYENVNDNQVQVLSLNVSQLPDGDDSEIIKALFKNQHVIKMQKETDNITGVSKGTGKIQLRCSDKLQSNEIIKSLMSKGLKVQVESQKNVKDITVSHQHDLKRKQYEETQKNQWMNNMRKEESKQKLIGELSKSTSSNQLLEMSMNQSLFASKMEKSLNHPKSRQTDLTQHSVSTTNTHNTSQQHHSKSYMDYMSNRSMMNQVTSTSNLSTNIYNTSVDDYSMNHRSVDKSPQPQHHFSIQSQQQSVTPTRVKHILNKENQVQHLTKVKSQLLQIPQENSVIIKPSFKQQQEFINRLTTEKFAPLQSTKHQTQNENNFASQSDYSNQKQAKVFNPNSNLLKPTQSSRSKRNFV